MASTADRKLNTFSFPFVSSLSHSMHSFFALATALTALVTVASSNPMQSGWPSKGSGYSQPSPSQTTSAASSATSSVVSSALSSASSSSTASSSAAPSCSGYFEPTAPPYLNDLAQAAGKLYLGSATDQPVRESLCIWKLWTLANAGDRELEKMITSSTKQFSTTLTSSAKSRQRTI